MRALGDRARQSWGNPRIRGREREEEAEEGEEKEAESRGGFVQALSVACYVKPRFACSVPRYLPQEPRAAVSAALYHSRDYSYRTAAWRKCLISPTGEPTERRKSKPLSDPDPPKETHLRYRL